MDDAALAHFKIFGYVVVPVFSPENVMEMRTQWHRDLRTVGIAHETILETGQPGELVGKKGPASRLFYSPWKLHTQLQLAPLAHRLLQATFASGTEPGFEHPLGPSTRVLPFLDRVAYRLPQHIQDEPGLGMHVDRNPHTPYAGSYFRPIQASIALTDHYGGASGGLCVVPKFHHQFDTFFQAYVAQQPAEPGNFFRMHSKSYAAVQKRLIPVTVPAGSVVFWDNRLPHATTSTLVSSDSREAVFFSYVPDVAVNRRYYAAQLLCMATNTVPPCFGVGSTAHTDPIPADLLQTYRDFL